MWTPGEPCACDAAISIASLFISTTPTHTHTQCSHTWLTWTNLFSEDWEQRRPVSHPTEEEVKEEGERGKEGGRKQQSGERRRNEPLLLVIMITYTSTNVYATRVRVSNKV